MTNRDQKYYDRQSFESLVQENEFLRRQNLYILEINGSLNKEVNAVEGWCMSNAPHLNDKVESLVEWIKKIANVRADTKLVP